LPDLEAEGEIQPIISHLLAGSPRNRLLRARPEGRNCPDQPHLGLPHTPLGPGALFKPSPGP